MITPGSYMFIRGTNIEVGIRRVSSDTMSPYAACTFRYGRYRWNHAQKRMYSQRDPIHLQVQKIPFACLSKTCAFTKRGALRSTYDPGEPCPTLTENVDEGLYVDEMQPYYNLIHKRNQKYFVLLKAMSKSNFRVGEQNVYSIFGLKELTFPLKYWNADRQVVVFDTEPVRKAHISVVRPYKSMAHLGGHSQRWSRAWKSVSYRNVSTAVDMGYVAGTSIAVHTLIQGEDVSFCKLNTYYNNYDILTMWVPHVEITTEAPKFNSDPAHMKRIVEGYLSNGVYVNGLPYRFIAAVPEGHSLLSADQHLLLQEEKQRYPHPEYFEDHEQTYIYLYQDIPSNYREDLDTDCTKWKAYLKNISTEPSAGYAYLSSHRCADAAAYVEDYKDRSNLIRNLQPVAVKV